MPNTLGLYNPLFYAQTALQQLEKSLGMAGRVYRGFDPTPQQKGQKIQIRRPTSFVATDMPNVASDLAPDTVEISLDYHKGVTFALTDKELSWTKEQVISEHIRPAAVAVADAVDMSLCGTVLAFPASVVGTYNPTDVTDITKLWQVLFDNNVPQDDLYLMLNGERTAKYMALPAFSQWQGAGQAGVDTQMRGALGQRFGFNIYSNQNVPTSATSTALTGVTQLQINAAAAKGATTVVVKDSDATLAGTVIAGDYFSIAGHSQKYAITANATAAANLFTLSIRPGLQIACAGNENVTLTQQVTGRSLNLAYHRNAIALAMAPLSELGNGRGAEIASVSDPITGLSLRSRIWYDAANTKLNVSIDALWGYQVLNENMGVRLEPALS